MDKSMDSAFVLFILLIVVAFVAFGVGWAAYQCGRADPRGAGRKNEKRLESVVKEERWILKSS